MRDQGGNPFDGWITNYKVDRDINEHEVRARLDRRSAVNLPPMDRGILKINSVFAEYVDRYFFLRGYAVVGGGGLSQFSLCGHL